MAVTTTYIKKTTTKAVVKLIGSGTATIALATDLFATGQTTSGTRKVHISGFNLSTANTNLVKITRNSIDVVQAFGNLDMSVIQDVTFSESESNDIVVDLGTGGATLILYLKKIEGYSAGPVF